MKILFVCLHNPFLTSTGAHQRSNNILYSLKNIADVDILIFDKFDNKIIWPNEWNVFYYDIKGRKGVSLFKKRVSQILHLLSPFSSNTIFPRNKFCIEKYNEVIKNKNYDFIFFRYVQSVFICGEKQLDNVIIDVDDIPWQNSLMLFKNKNYNLLKRLYHLYKASIIKLHSKKVIENARLTFLANANDCFAEKSFYLPNIPYTRTLQSKSRQITNHNLLFVGSLKHIPNIEGLDHFITNIWPYIRCENNSAELYIVGKGLSDEMIKKWELLDGINLMGYVENLEEIYEICPIVITPIYSGAGTNIKLLEALYMGKICIASSFSLRGFEDYFVDGRDLFVVQNDDEFINKTNYALSNLDKIHHIGLNSREIIDQKFSLDRFTSILTKAILS